MIPGGSVLIISMIAPDDNAPILFHPVLTSIVSITIWALDMFINSITKINR